MQNYTIISTAEFQFRLAKHIVSQNKLSQNFHFGFVRSGHDTRSNELSETYRILRSGNLNGRIQRCAAQLFGKGYRVSPCLNILVGIDNIRSMFYSGVSIAFFVFPNIQISSPRRLPAVFFADLEITDEGLRPKTLQRVGKIKVFEIECKREEADGLLDAIGNKLPIKYVDNMHTQGGKE